MSTYAFGPFQLISDKLLLIHGGRLVALGPKVVETLLALVERPGEVLAKASLMDRIWPDSFVEESNLAQNIHVLRKTFRHHDLADPIETIPCRGYRFTAPVRRLVDGPAERSPSRWIVAASVGAAFVAASIVLIASSGLRQHSAAPLQLSSIAARQYQIGRYYWNLRTRDGVQKSLHYFARVVDIDPNDARGYAALADANVTMGEYCYGTHRPEVYFARARAYADKALALNPNSAEAHAARGILALNRKDSVGAISELQRSIALDPFYGPAQEWYGIAMLVGGRSAEGIVHLKIAADIDPLSVATIAWLASAAFVDRRFGDAIVYSREALELSPRRTDALATIGEAYEAQGNINGAVDAFKRYGAVNEFYRPEAAALLARAYALGRRMPEARSQLAYARTHASQVDPVDLAAAAAAVGDPSGIARLPHEHIRHGAMFA